MQLSRLTLGTQPHTAPIRKPPSVDVGTLVYLSALGAGAGSFICMVLRYLLPGIDFDYSKFAGVGAGTGFGVGLVWLLTDTLLY